MHTEGSTDIRDRAAVQIVELATEFPLQSDGVVAAQRMADGEIE